MKDWTSRTGGTARPLTAATPASSPAPEARQALMNGLWDTGRKALLMMGKAVATYADTCQDRNASILADVLLAGANAIEKRTRS